MHVLSMVAVVIGTALSIPLVTLPAAGRNAAPVSVAGAGGVHSVVCPQSMTWDGVKCG